MIQYPSWNTTIPAGGKAVVGFTGKKNEKLTIPTDCKILGGRNDVAEEDYTITYQVTSDWKDAFHAEIAITNHTSENVEGWQLAFDYPCKITNLWTSRLVSHEGNHYLIKSDGWNATLRAGATIRLGFEAIHVSGNGTGTADEEPSNFTLTALDSESRPGDTKEEDDSGLIHEFTDEELAIDTDQDELPDCYEKEVLKTDPANPDTDGDGLPDGYEFLHLGSDPLVKDGDLDNDEDGLTNLEEYQLGSDPSYDDSDNDGLTDSEEVKQYYTDPTKEDTDGDGIWDQEELSLGLDPTKKDTDANGIEDGKEKVGQSFSVKFDDEEKDARGLAQITVQGNFTNYAEYTTEIENMYGTDIFATDVVGLVGVPFDITTTSGFDQATVSIEYKSLPKGTKAEDLGVLWYHEKANLFEVIDSTVDVQKKQVSFQTTHFSTYLLADIKKWKKIWKKPISYGNSKKAVDACDAAYVVDVSQSMDQSWFSTIRKAMKSLVDTMISDEKGSLIGYKISACKLYQGATGKKKTLKKAMDAMKPEKKSPLAKSGVTVEGIKKGIAQLKKGNSKNGRMLFVIGDADIAYESSLVTQAKKQHIQIFVVNVNKKNDLPQLKKYASETGGFYYTLDKMKYLQGLLFDIKHAVLEGINTTDTDGDGLFDVYEKKGMRFCNGKIIKTDPKKKDTDGDILTDREEMGYPVWVKKDGSNGHGIVNYKTCFAGSSYPVGMDTDWDGFEDTKDVSPKDNRQKATYVRKDEGSRYSYSLSYPLSYNWFLTNNKKYNKDLAHVSSILAGLAYYASYDKNASYYKVKAKPKGSKKAITYNLQQYMSYLGFSDTK